MTREYPENAEAADLLRMLLASCDALRHKMGGSEATRNCTGLLREWDDRDPTIFYLQRNMEWARELLARTAPRDEES